MDLNNFLSFFGDLSSDPNGLTAFKFQYLPTLGFAAIVIFLGRFLVSKSRALQKYAIPAPVVSGLLFSIIIAVIKISGIGAISFDATITKDLSQNIFFLAIGYGFSTSLFKNAGKKLIVNVIIASVLLICLQDLVGVVVGNAIGLNPFLSLQASSSAMSGGVGTAAAFGPIYEKLGAPSNVTEFGVAAGTMGNIMGSLIGGPVAAFLISRHHLKADPNDKPPVEKEGILPVIDNQRFIKAFAMILLVAALGVPIHFILDSIPLIEMPRFIACLFAGAIARNVLEKTGRETYVPEVTAIQDMFLELYLALVLMTIDITAIASQAGQMLIILLAQAILMAVFAIFISYRMFGKDYGAAVMAAGNCGWGCGSGPNAVANIKAVMEEYGYNHVAWIFYPSFAVIIDDIFNPILLSILGNVFS